MTAGATLGWLGSGGDTYVYSNPYYVTPASSDTYVYNYSQPIEQSSDAYANTYDSGSSSGSGGSADSTQDGSQGSGAEQANNQPTDPKTTAAMQKFTSAQQSFKNGDYAAALSDVDAAIENVPNDAVLHEFRALALFAQGKYQEAAATIYAVLSVGPGWNWETLRSLYPNTETYTQQLRALETYQKQNHDAGYASFLLAYQYMVTNHPEAAIKQLENVVRTTPNDELSKQLLKALQQNQQQPPPGP
jgi:tetratricopeptide (TPR) repeat protein